MDAETLSRAAEDAFARLVPEDARHLLTLAVDPSREQDPLWPDIAATTSYTIEDDGRVAIEVFGGVISEDELEAALSGAIVGAMSELEIREALPTEEALFEAHARFRADEPVFARFYQAGQPMGPGAFIVDLDIFVELRVLASAWADLRGRHLRLALDEDGIVIEVPEDAEPDEILTLPGAGLLDADDTLDEEDTFPPTGDLHVIPVIYS